MAGILADYGSEWQHLSKRHEELEQRIEAVLTQYCQVPGTELKWAYAVVGTFGAGKTQLLYHIFDKAMGKGLLPLYFFAEDLFREVISAKDNRVWSPANVNDLVVQKAEEARASLAKSDRNALKAALHPRNESAARMLEGLIARFGSADVNSVKTVLLLDELEQQYGTLQEKVEAKDRSPLRGWLEGKENLKFVALAPAGIYEMGGADQTRVDRIVIPPADVSYIRENYLPQSAGKANACWWLSRGKPRHLFKAYEKLKDLDTDALEVPAIHLLVRDELDSIGQEPSRVPAVVLEGIPATQCHWVLNLAPVDGETGRRYVIDASNLDAGLFAEKLTAALGMRTEDAALIGGYLKMVAKALSDQTGFSYVDVDDLPQILALAFDLFLEYEHASPQVKDRLRELMGLYERLGEAVLHVELSRLWDCRNISKQLPLSVKQIREAFPFPVMSPMVKDFLPKDIEQKYEGQGLPVWKWEEGNVTVLFFASSRDFSLYSQKDEFYSLAFPDNKGVLCILPTQDGEGGGSLLQVWLDRNGKLRIVSAPPLLSDFLLSAAGEIENLLPGELLNILDRFIKEKDDVILCRKARIYYEAINDLVTTNLPRPAVFCRDVPPQADTVWGKSQIANPAIAVAGCALAFSSITAEESKSLAALRELFKGDREGKGAGSLHPFIVRPRAGHTSLADDLLPRLDTKGQLRDSPAVARLREYFGATEKQLSELTRLVALRDFLKLEDEEDRGRLLEAFWRAVRGEFDEAGLDDLAHRLETEVVPVVTMANELETQAISNLGLEGIGFGDADTIVRANAGFERLLKNAKDIIQGKGSAAALVKNLYILLVRQLLENIDSDLSSLNTTLGRINTAFSNMKTASEDLKRNFWQYGKATQFADINEQDMDAFIAQETRIQGIPSLEELEAEITARKGNLEEASGKLSSLENTLEELETTTLELRED